LNIFCITNVKYFVSQKGRSKFINILQIEPKFADAKLDIRN